MSESGRDLDTQKTLKRIVESGHQSPRKRRRSRFAAIDSDAGPDQNKDSAPTATVGTKRDVEARDRENKMMPHLGLRDAPSARERTAASIDLMAIPVAPVSTLKINQSFARIKKIKQTLKVLESDLLDTDPSRNAYFDPSIRVRTETRRPARPQLTFYDPGEITEKANKERRRAEQKAADARFRELMAAKTAKAETLPQLQPLSDGRVAGNSSDVKIPDIDWWDAPFLDNKSFTNFSIDRPNLRNDRITHYVHHPTRIAPTDPKKAELVVPVMLTHKERRRVRRQRRENQEKERREMIAVGLLPPPPPKVKLSNLVRVLADEATADPTRVEADVRAQVLERQKKHEADNEARKKTKEEVREKVAERTRKDREESLRASVYRIVSVDNPQHRYKVDINARQLGLTGSFIVYSNCNLVIVEGGAKALRKYQKLMLRRIDWSDTRSATTDEDAPESPQGNQCVLIWEGIISSPAFNEFKTVTLPTHSSVKSYLRRRHIDSYFDLAVSWCAGNTSMGVIRAV